MPYRYSDICNQHTVVPSLDGQQRLGRIQDTAQSFLHVVTLPQERSPMIQASATVIATEYHQVISKKLINPLGEPTGGTFQGAWNTLRTVRLNTTEDGHHWWISFRPSIEQLNGRGSPFSWFCQRDGRTHKKVGRFA